MIPPGPPASRGQRTCDICGQRYDTVEEARACEQQPLDIPVVQVGDIVYARAGYGWFDGDAIWVSNLETLAAAGRRPAGADAGNTLTGSKQRAHGNCFDACCTYRFYYVVTHIDLPGEEAPGRNEHDMHRVRYHLATGALRGAGRIGWTFTSSHFTPEPAGDVPEAVRRAAEALVGERAGGLL